VDRRVKLVEPGVCVIQFVVVYQKFLIDVVATIPRVHDSTQPKRIVVVLRRQIPAVVSLNNGKGLGRERNFLTEGAQLLASLLARTSAWIPDIVAMIGVLPAAASPTFIPSLAIASVSGARDAISASSEIRASPELLGGHTVPDVHTDAIAPLPLAALTITSGGLDARADAASCAASLDD
jgi:hypothetical protein